MTLWRGWKGGLYFKNKPLQLPDPTLQYDEMDGAALTVKGAGLFEVFRGTDTARARA